MERFCYSLAEARELPRQGNYTSVQLYRLYAHDGVLLYVGVTGWSMRERFTQHKRNHPDWWREVADVSFEIYGAMWIALRAEVAAIRAESPIYNRRSAVKAA